MTDSFSDTLCVFAASHGKANCPGCLPPPDFESLMTSAGGLPPVLKLLFRS